MPGPSPLARGCRRDELNAERFGSRNGCFIGLSLQPSQTQISALASPGPGRAGLCLKSTAESSSPASRSTCCCLSRPRPVPSPDHAAIAITIAADRRSHTRSIQSAHNEVERCHGRPRAGRAHAGAAAFRLRATDRPTPRPPGHPRAEPVAPSSPDHRRGETIALQDQQN
jgi:hypothetical protein